MAAETFARMLAEAGPGRITVLTGRQFDAEARYVEKRATGSSRSASSTVRRAAKSTTAARYSSTPPTKATWAPPPEFRSGPGAKGAAEYGEPCAGKIYRWWKHGPDAEGTTYEGDDAIQAYNYRLCLTDDPQNRLAIPRPENYDREEYVSLVGDVLDGRNTDARYRTADSAAIARNRRRIEAGERTSAPGDVWGMAKVTSMTRLPNAKTDANNQHLALPLHGPARREPSVADGRLGVARPLRQTPARLHAGPAVVRPEHDEALPVHFREACLRWGLAADEYRDNGGFPRQVYVREGRRLEGCHFFTAQDALPEAEGKRPPLHRSSVTASHYALDSHAVRKREPGRIHLDGFFSHPTAVYTVPYGVMVPRRVENLLFPTAVSGSHVGFSTLRMEPCWMALGEAAGTAAALAADSRRNVREIPVDSLQERLLRHGAVLVYLRDLRPGDPDYAAVQRLALRGFFPEWEAGLDRPLDASTARLWSSLAGRGITADGTATRREWIRRIAMTNF